jgi:hypothetical protein
MAESNVVEAESRGPLIVRLTPLLVGLLAAIVALIVATLRGLPLPLDVAAVFLVIGLAAAWIARRTPLLGNLFVALIAIIVFAVIYTS